MKLLLPGKPMTRAGLLKLLFLMRLTAMLILITSLHLCANTFSQKVSVSGQKLSLQSVFESIEKQTGYQFIYSSEILKEVKLLDLDFKNTELTEVLRACLHEQNLRFEIKRKIIIIKPANRGVDLKSTPALSPSLTSPPITVRGRIVNEKGEPVIASINVKGTNKGSVADNNGWFSISNIDENSVLIISGISVQTKEVEVNGQKDLLINVITAIKEEHEVVVNAGYYKVDDRLRTGNIVKVSGEEIAKQPVMNVMGALDGRVTGMMVTQTTGLPGGAFKVDIRGRTAIDRSISDDQPLFIVDGVPLASNNTNLSILFSALNSGNPITGAKGGVSALNGLNPQDIESITVLKDADATAIYGSRGANGVVLITTKKGLAGKPQVNINFYQAAGISHPVATLNTQEYLKMRRQAYINDGDTIPWWAYDINGKWDTTRYTNFAELFNGNTASTSDLQASLSGGSSNILFLLNGAYHRETSPLPKDLFYERGSFHSTINYISHNNNFKVNFSSLFSTDNNNLVTSDPASAFTNAPNIYLYDGNGNLGWNEGGLAVSLSHPLSVLYNSYNTKSNNLLANIRLSYQITKGLIVRTNLGYNLVNTREIVFDPIIARNPSFNPTGSSTFGNTQFKSWIAEPQIEYNHTFRKSTLNFLVGLTFQSNENIAEQIDAGGYNSDDLLGSLSGATNIDASNTFTQYKYEAVFGRLNYNLNDRYVINLTSRRDGSSRFAPENRFANFGAIGAAWIFTNEKFLRNTSVLSFGKLRGSYGITGNDKISDYKYLDAWASTESSYGNVAGLNPTGLYNAGFKWEKTNKLEVGVELGLFNDRVLLTASRYNNKSSNQLVNYRLPELTGYNSVLRNFPALVENKGTELTLSVAIIKNPDFNWTIRGNISFQKNILLRFPDIENSSYNGMYVVGQSLNLINKIKYLGVNPQTGLYTFEDFNKDGAVTIEDFQPLGNTDPKYFGGLQNSVRLKNFQFDAFFSFRKQTGYTYLATIIYVPGQAFSNNLPEGIMGKFWAQPGDNAELQRLSASYGDAYYSHGTFTNVSNGVFGDASFIRLKNVSLSYNFPQKILQKLSIGNCRLYIQGQNLCTISNYEIGDPETQTLYVTSPPTTIAAGIQVTFK